jgi:hypothetical protein
MSLRPIFDWKIPTYLDNEILEELLDPEALIRPRELDDQTLQQIFLLAASEISSRNLFHFWIKYDENLDESVFELSDVTVRCDDPSYFDLNRYREYFLEMAKSPIFELMTDVESIMTPYSIEDIDGYVNTPWVEEKISFRFNFIEGRPDFVKNLYSLLDNSQYESIYMNLDFATINMNMGVDSRSNFNSVLAYLSQEIFTDYLSNFYSLSDNEKQEYRNRVVYTDEYED